jgi:hypothetical protein
MLRRARRFRNAVPCTLDMTDAADTAGRIAAAHRQRLHWI